MKVTWLPIFQSRYGNGGIGVVVAFAASEFVVFPGALLILRREKLGSGMGVDMLRALGAAGGTIGLFAAAPALPWYLGIPACLVFFTGASLALGLVSRSELSVLWSMLRRRRAPAVIEPP